MKCSPAPSMDSGTGIRSRSCWIASIALEAANPAYETRIFGPDQVQVQGKLVGLIRRYH